MELPSNLQTSHDEIKKLRSVVSTQERAMKSKDAEILYLSEQLSLMRTKLFGRSSERRLPEESPDQMLLFPGRTEPVREPEKQSISYERRSKRSVEGKLPEGVRFPEHLAREEIVIDEGEGEIAFTKVTERLAVNGSPFYVKRIVRNIRKQDGSLESPAVPPAVLDRCSADVSFLVYILVMKYIWHLPLYRQEQMLKSYGISISRDTLIRYVLSLASLLKPIYVALGTELFSLDHLFGDETPVMVGKGAKGDKKYSKSHFWTFLGKLGCVFYYTRTRAFKEVEPLIKSFQGILQSDGYCVYETVARHYPEVTLASCFAHVRRKFIDAEKGADAAYAKQALRYIRALYRVEERIRKRELKPPDILRLRQRFSKKILGYFEKWLKERASDPTLLPKSLFGKAIGYTLNRFEALSLYTGDPKLAIDSNAVEREIRPVALGKKNWLFCASEVGAEASAIIYSLIASCRLADVDPTEYLTDVLERISEHPASRVVDLIPINWKVAIKAPKEIQPDLPQVA